jgi:hypothetical protein
VGQLALRHVLRVVAEEEGAEHRDVEHALVIGDQDVGRVGRYRRIALDEQARSAQPQCPHEAQLQRPGDDFLGAPPEQTRQALERVEDQQGDAERQEEGRREEPIP